MLYITPKKIVGFQATRGNCFLYHSYILFYVLLVRFREVMKHEMKGENYEGTRQSNCSNWWGEWYGA